MVRYRGTGGSLEGGRNIILNLKNGVASILVTRYVPKYNTKVVTRYMTKYQRVITSLTINYLLNGQVITQVVIPTRIVMQEITSTAEGGLPNNTSTVARRRRNIRTVPKNFKNIQELIV